MNTKPQIRKRLHPNFGYLAKGISDNLHDVKFFKMVQWIIVRSKAASFWHNLKSGPRTICQNKTQSTMSIKIPVNCFMKEVTFHSLPRIISDSFVKVSTHASATLTCPLFSYSKCAELKIWDDASEADTLKNRGEVVKSRSVGNLSLTITSILDPPAPSHPRRY